MKLSLLSFVFGVGLSTTAQAQVEHSAAQVRQTFSVRSYETMCDVPHRDGNSGAITAYSRVWIDTNNNLVNGQIATYRNYRISIAKPRATRTTPVGQESDGTLSDVWGLEMDVVGVDKITEGCDGVCTSIQVVGIASKFPVEILLIDDLEGNLTISGDWINEPVRCERNSRQR